MTAPTHYNGKTIPSGTWLAHAAEVVGEQGESVTDSTPDIETRLRALSVRATEGGMYEANETLLVANMAAALIEAADALAVVTAERDQARQVLADAPHESDCRALADEYEDLFPCSCCKANS